VQDRKPGTGIDEREAGRGSEPVSFRAWPWPACASQLGALRSRPYANDSFEAEFEEWVIMNLEQPVRDVDAEIRIRAAVRAADVFVAVKLRCRSA
jgi:hypothetical protein